MLYYKKAGMMVMCLIVLAVLTLALAKHSHAITLDLGHPIYLPYNATNITGPEGGDRNVVFNALGAFNINSAGIYFDPLVGGATAIEVAIYAMNLTGGVGTRGALLASSFISITDNGFQFYDVPINFSFTAGTRYDIGFKPVPPEIWGNGINNMEFYAFDYTNDPSFTVGGLVEVLDGGRSGWIDGTGGGFTNRAMPHVDMNTSKPVPEPATMLLLGSGLIVLAGYGRKKFFKK
jgi:hypothetical protein